MKVELRCEAIARGRATREVNGEQALCIEMVEHSRQCRVVVLETSQAMKVGSTATFFAIPIGRGSEPDDFRRSEDAQQTDASGYLGENNWDCKGTADALEYLLTTQNTPGLSCRLKHLDVRQKQKSTPAQESGSGQSQYCFPSVELHFVGTIPTRWGCQGDKGCRDGDVDARTSRCVSFRGA